MVFVSLPRFSSISGASRSCNMWVGYYNTADVLCQDRWVLLFDLSSSIWSTVSRKYVRKFTRNSFAVHNLLHCRRSNQVNIYFLLHINTPKPTQVKGPTCASLVFLLLFVLTRRKSVYNWLVGGRPWEAILNTSFKIPWWRCVSPCRRGKYFTRRCSQHSGWRQKILLQKYFDGSRERLRSDCRSGERHSQKLVKSTVLVEGSMGR